MPTAQMVVELQEFEPKSPADHPIRVRGLGVCVLDWLMKTQKRRAERLIQRHPEWRVTVE
jgi:hypothetical protein